MKINLRPKKMVANDVTTTSYKYYGNAIKSLRSQSNLVFFLNQLSQDKETAVSPAQNAINKRLVVDCAESSDSGEEYDLETNDGDDGGTAKDQRCGKYKQFWLSAQHRHKLLCLYVSLPSTDRTTISIIPACPFQINF